MDQVGRGCMVERCHGHVVTPSLSCRRVERWWRTLVLGLCACMSESATAQLSTSTRTCCSSSELRAHTHTHTHTHTRPSPRLCPRTMEVESKYYADGEDAFAMKRDLSDTAKLIESERNSDTTAQELGEVLAAVQGNLSTGQ